MKRKRVTVKPRNPLVPAMRLSRKPGAFVDRKKEARRKACRLFSSLSTVRDLHTDHV
ncbi:MAG: hypothetical protein RDU20_02445 [Desulfomonilaceae bacterium]|nr:hypothetical protein [Desulfomonilaceae bacterium]